MDEPNAEAKLIQAIASFEKYRTLFKPLRTRADIGAAKVAQRRHNYDEPKNGRVIELVSFK